ncbi:hypothetical protein JDV02_006483 [Purpureocillium takamizusanense]|nr:uncharacterized protein JDV02_006483 [Purpureocillium takamizusanense]UNI20391.1 hypothetical protein JDV02_006483 [Purpureocillium takamizusanense]
MERLLRSTTQIAHLRSSNPQGCPVRQLACGHEFGSADMFAKGAVASRSFADPAFLVPAVIEALKSSVQYRQRVLMVPGEADTFCARHALSNGGVVLTSDSDLLVHEVGDAEVVFFRDIQRQVDSTIMVCSYGPKRICEQLGQSPTDGLVRLAYEQKRLQHASLAQILQACSSPPLHEKEYAEFCEDYRSSDISQIPLPCGHGPLENGSLDPRLAELAIQLQSTSIATSHAHMFLPVLTEDPTRGNAWEHSTSVRQLAYSLLIGPDPTVSVLEFRRIQSATQKGRRVELDGPDLQGYAIELLAPLHKVSAIVPGHNSRFWLLACLVLDVIECQKRDKGSLAWSIFQQPAKSPAANRSRISWDTVHAVAQLQAMCYSLRLLRQALSVCSKVPANIKPLQQYLEQLPELNDFPDVDSFNDGARKLSEYNGLVVSLEQCLGSQKLRQNKTDHGINATASGVGKPANQALPTEPGHSIRRNMFDVLSLE